MVVSVAEADNLPELYRELILDHARSPRHFGKPAKITHSADGINPLCGDKLHVYLQVSDGNRIEDVGFEGTGCAISMASASLMTETVAGMEAEAALGFGATLTSHLGGVQAEGTAAVDIEMGKLRALEGVREFPSRVKCATLAWHALRAALLSNPQPAGSE